MQTYLRPAHCSIHLARHLLWTGLGQAQGRASGWSGLPTHRQIQQHSSSTQQSILLLETTVGATSLQMGTGRRSDQQQEQTASTLTQAKLSSHMIAAALENHGGKGGCGAVVGAGATSASLPMMHGSPNAVGGYSAHCNFQVCVGVATVLRWQVNAACLCQALVASREPRVPRPLGAKELNWQAATKSLQLWMHDRPLQPAH